MGPDEMEGVEGSTRHRACPWRVLSAPAFQWEGAGAPLLRAGDPQEARLQEADPLVLLLSWLQSPGPSPFCDKGSSASTLVNPKSALGSKPTPGIMTVLVY